MRKYLLLLILFFPLLMAFSMPQQLRMILSKEHKDLIFYVNPYLYGDMQDKVSRTTASLTRAGDLVYLDSDDTYQTASANQTAIGKYGVFHDGAGENLAPYSEDFSQWDVLQNITGLNTDNEYTGIIADTSDTSHRAVILAIGNINGNSTYTFSCLVAPGNKDFCRFYVDQYNSTDISLGSFYGTLDISTGVLSNDSGGLSAGIVEEDIVIDGKSFNRVYFTFTTDPDTVSFRRLDIYPSDTANEHNFAGDGETVNIWIYGAQLEEKAYASSYILTNGAAASRVTQAADASDNGYSWAFADLDSRVESSLSDKGTLIVEMRPEFPEAANDGFGLISFANSIINIFYSNDSDTFLASDGTNTIYDASGFEKSKLSQSVVRWGSGQLELLNKIDGESSWTYDSNSFDGAFATNDDLRLFYLNEYPMWIKSIRMYDSVLDNSTIEQELQ